MRATAPVRPIRRLAVLARFGPRFLLLMVACAAAIGFSYWRERASDREVASANARGVLALQHRMLDGELDVVLSTLRYLANQTTVLDYISDPDSRAAVEHDFLEFSRQSARFDQIRILDEAGDEVVRIDFCGGEPAAVPLEELQSKAERYYFQVTANLAPLEVYVSPFDLNVEHGAIESPWKPVIRLATVASARGRRFVLVLNYLGENLLDRLRQASGPVVGWSALVSADGHFLEGPTEELSWGFMFDAAPTFAARHPDVWEAMLAHEEGALSTEQGMFAFRRFQPDSEAEGRYSDLRLTLVAFTPNGLLYRSSSRVLRILALVGGGVAVLLGLASWQLALGAELRAAHEERLELSERHLRDLSSRLLNAQETERRNLSRDLHDELGQIATAVTIDLQRAQKNPPERDALLQRAASGVSEILASVREISSRLRTSLLDDLGLRDALLDQCANFAEHSGLAVDARIELEDDQIAPEIGIHVYRIVQESLNNVLRHAGAARVGVRVALEDGQVRIEVVDDGAGFEIGEASSTSLGLTGMRERVELLAGELEIVSGTARGTAGRGTTVRARIPVAGPVSDEERST